MNSLNTKKLATSLAGGLFISMGLAHSHIAMADNSSGPYASAGLGVYKAKGDEFEDDNTFYNLSLGYRVMSVVGFELGYKDFGEFGGDLASAEVNGISASVVGFLPITESVEFKAELGQFYSETDVSVAGFDESFDDETLFYGLGADFKLTEQFWISAEYQRYEIEFETENWPVDIDDEDAAIDTFSIGATFRF